MIVSAELFAKNCNTIAVAARDLAADYRPPLKDAAAAVTCRMCYSLIAETCDTLAALSKKNIDLANWDFDPLVAVASILIRGTARPDTEG